MSTTRIKTSHSGDEPIPENIIKDHDWVRRHEQELRAQFGESFVVVYQQMVYGVGDSYQAALEDAEQHLPPEIHQIVVMVESLQRRPPIFAFRPVPPNKG